MNTTSADWREGMTLGLALEVPSFAPWPGAGVAISAFVRPDFVLESAASAHFGQSMPSGSESYQAWLLQLHGRIFFGNSWNVSAGGALYSFNEVEDLEPAEEGGPEAHTDTTLVTSGLRFALGNHWQWSVATVGVDWIGVYVPFVAIQRDFRSEGLTSEERRRARNAFLKADLLPVPEFLKVRFGVSF